MATEQWKIDATHSGVNFTVRHMVFAKVHGRFTKFEGTIAYDEANPSASKVDVSIDTASVNTADEKRDGHLKSPDFLDAEKFPTMTFKSKSVEKGGSGLKVKGDLALHGVTKEVTLDVEVNGRGKDPWGGERSAFTGKTTIDRREYGVVYNQTLEAGGVLVGEKIEIVLDIEATKV